MSDDLPGMLIYLDPGATTGYALLMRDGGFAAGQVQGTAAFGDWLGDVLTRTGVPTHIGWEGYQVVGARSRESTVGLRVMGVAEYLACRHGARVLPEVASSMRTVAPTAAVHRLGWYRAGLPHAMDAARHLLAYLIRSGIAPELVRSAFTNPADSGTT